ncbi:MAG: MarR family transcriptional regulator [Sphingomonadaceae bacterium]|nr:MarR family transcriptional regulator [Sphingomonadaceae bacterium]
MLDLFAAEAERRRVTITDACIATGLSMTSALRQLKYLEARNLLERRSDPEDARRSFARLSRNARERMIAALGSFTR